MKVKKSWFSKAIEVFKREAWIANDRKLAFAKSRGGQVLLLLFAIYLAVFVFEIF